MRTPIYLFMPSLVKIGEAKMTKMPFQTPAVGTTEAIPQKIPRGQQE